MTDVLFVFLKKPLAIYFFSGSFFHSKLQRFEMTAFKPLSLKSALG